MRSVLFAAALLCGGTALAQDYSTTTTTTTTTEATQVPAGPVVAPSNANPERDARGIPVISDPAVSPPGFNQPAGTNGMGGPLVDPSQPPAPQPATQSYPPCSRTITDHCVQTYERGRSPTG
ncbi:MAG TPA: hypothetical protein VGW40_13465 [Allosphingosinicella sp.]|nr:hypothetical protein [Allosphingosinicella sp.]